MTRVLEGKKIAIVIAFRGFRDPEYFIPKNILRAAGAQVVTVSSQKGLAMGDDGGEAQVNVMAEEFKIDDFDAVVFIGGPGMGKNLDDRSFQKIAQDTVKAGKVLAAICIAPALLAKAGVLAGKKATVWSGPLDKSAIKILKEGGALYSTEEVVVDGQIITAPGPLAAKKFGEKIVEVLTGNLQ